MSKTFNLNTVDAAKENKVLTAVAIRCFSVSQEHLATETIFEEISGTDSSLILGELQELTGIKTH